MQLFTGIAGVYDRNMYLSALSSPKLLANFEEEVIRTPPPPRSEGDILSSPHLKAFTLNDLKNATRSFRPDNLIGEGGFGDVYKGWIDEQTLGAASSGQGMVVAVKKLKPEGFQGHQEWLVGFFFSFSASKCVFFLFSFSFKYIHCCLLLAV